MVSYIPEGRRTISDCLFRYFLLTTTTPKEADSQQKKTRMIILYWNFSSNATHPGWHQCVRAMVFLMEKRDSFPDGRQMANGVRSSDFLTLKRYTFRLPSTSWRWSDLPLKPTQSLKIDGWNDVSFQIWLFWVSGVYTPEKVKDRHKLKIMFSSFCC